MDCMGSYIHYLDYYQPHRGLLCRNTLNSYFLNSLPTILCVFWNKRWDKKVTEVNKIARLFRKLTVKIGASDERCSVMKTANKIRLSAFEKNLASYENAKKILNIITFTMHERFF